MQEKKGLVAFKGNPLTLLGEQIRVGQKAPDFEVLANDLTPVRLSSFAGKIVIISCVPSLDTGVCDVQTRRFNQEAANFSEDVVVLTISMDLPFAQSRWCGAAGVNRVKTLSDHRNADFGLKYGLLIKELRLLARAVLIIDKQSIVRYVHIVPELTTEPDYAAVLNALKQIQ